MTARGVDFLENWIDSNVHETKPDWVKARTLAEKLRADAATAGFTLADLELEENEAEKYIMDSMVALDEPGMPGD